MKNSIRDFTQAHHAEYSDIRSTIFMNTGRSETSMAALMRKYITEQSGIPMPESVERTLDRQVTFAQPSFNNTGRGMELPHFTYGSTSEDDIGKFIPVRWGFSEFHHSVSKPVMIRDRRSQMVDFLTAHAQAVEFEQCLQEMRTITEQITTTVAQQVELRSLQKNPRQLEQLTSQTSLLNGMISRLQQTQISQLETDFLYALQRKDTMAIAQYAQDVIDRQLAMLQRKVLRLNSLLEPIQQKLNSLPQPQHDATQPDANRQAHNHFTDLPGVVRTNKIRHGVANRTITEIDIIDVRPSQDMDGQFEFVAVGTHSPKPIPVGWIALELIEERFSLMEEPLFGQPTIGSETISAGGIYQPIHFSSGTGRHSGWGYMRAVPNVAESSKVMELSN